MTLPRPKGGSQRRIQSRPKHWTRPLYSTRKVNILHLYKDYRIPLFPDGDFDGIGRIPKDNLIVFAKKASFRDLRKPPIEADLRELASRRTGFNRGALARSF